MKDVNPTHLRPKVSTQQQVPNELAYMPLQGMSSTGEGSFTPKSPAPNVEYAPLDMRTRSWEVARNDVKVEKIIGKGAFGQVAKGTGKNLPFRSGETSLAIKMIKGKCIFRFFPFFPNSLLFFLAEITLLPWFAQFSGEGGGWYLGQFLLGMCRWPLRTSTPL